MNRKIQSVIRRLRLLPLWLLVTRSPARSVIEADVNRWLWMIYRQKTQDDMKSKLQALVYGDNLEEFRNLLYFRLGTPARLWDRVLLFFATLFLAPLETLLITSASTVGEGLVIMHGHGTYVDAERIGRNCLVFQDVAVGAKREEGQRPTIGDYVHISTGSKVLGGITIGDHSVVAANAVVVKDMPPNSLAVGVPARILQNAGNKAEYIARGEISE
jgi:serine O-acetyltransferase